MEYVPYFIIWSQDGDESPLWALVTLWVNFALLNINIIKYNSI